MIEVFGDFTEQLSLHQGSLELIFSPSSIALKKRWRNNRLSAYFVADYCSSFIPVDEDNNQDKQRIKESKAIVSYVANELIENAMRYNDAHTQDKVKFGIYFLDSPQTTEELTVVIMTINRVSESDIKPLKNLINEVLESDPDELYLTRIEKSLENQDSDTSGLGFLTMINDYSAKLGWKFERQPHDYNGIFVTIMATIKI
ncbi:DUF6272 family protein [Crocosphaera sp. UHCC 0190]|uniref:DUF6272 family protein n=1 Tax=Crocosphaera sp. UHCC 0190 TaxID=3110246 RepID=UPI002B2052EB|nr:DUF6272 family protein [Crocosphaera sp. UHCC 0190]MEA5511391.1 DUF6272 family protein [Crocosphaera sp. UHCC 0190]